MFKFIRLAKPQMFDNILFFGKTEGNDVLSYCVWWVYKKGQALYRRNLVISRKITYVLILEHYLSLPFFGIGMKKDLLLSCGHCCVFQICWHIECSTFTASSFRILKS